MVFDKLKGSISAEEERRKRWERERKEGFAHAKWKQTNPDQIEQTALNTLYELQPLFFQCAKEMAKLAKLKVGTTGKASLKNRIASVQFKRGFWLWTDFAEINKISAKLTATNELTFHASADEANKHGLVYNKLLVYNSFKEVTDLAKAKEWLEQTFERFCDGFCKLTCIR